MDTPAISRAGRGITGGSEAFRDLTGAVGRDNVPIVAGRERLRYQRRMGEAGVSVCVCVCVTGCGARAPAVTLPRCPAGLSTEKAVAFTRRLRAEPQFLLAQNVATCNDPLEVCLQRQVVQDTVQVFQHAVPAEGKPVTNQKNSGEGGRGRGRCLGADS